MEADLMSGENMYQSQQVTSNEGYSDANALQIRLDPTVLSNQIEQFLKGQRPTFDAEGRVQILPTSNALCSDDGVNFVLTRFWLVCNPQVFQGKIDESLFQDIVYRFHRNFAYELMLRKREFNISDGNYATLVNGMVDFLELTLSGVVGGFRSEKLTQGVQTRETIGPLGGLGAGYGMMGRRRRGFL